MKTILITGSSSGFGLETARWFLEREWTVIATMRPPLRNVLPASDRLRLLALDVTDAASIARAIADAGPIDALVNNAGAGLMGPLEGVPMVAVRELFELNTFGVMAMSQAVLPRFRKQGAGVIVNVSSAVTLKPLPMLSVYTASKAAIEAFSENLALETEQFGVRVRVVIPGRAPQTSFSASARARSQNTIPEAYAGWAREVFSAAPPQPAEVTTTSDVAEAVWWAVTDPNSPFRIPAGADAELLAQQAASHLTQVGS